MGSVAVPWCAGWCDTDARQQVRRPTTVIKSWLHAVRACHGSGSLIVGLWLMLVAFGTVTQCRYDFGAFHWRLGWEFWCRHACAHFAVKDACCNVNPLNAKFLLFGILFGSRLRIAIRKFPIIMEVGGLGSGRAEWMRPAVRSRMHKG